jgi:hypothetical protein
VYKWRRLSPLTITNGHVDLQGIKRALGGFRASCAVSLSLALRRVIMDPYLCAAPLCAVLVFHFFSSSLVSWRGWRIRHSNSPVHTKHPNCVKVVGHCYCIRLHMLGLWPRKTGWPQVLGYLGIGARLELGPICKFSIWFSS